MASPDSIAQLEDSEDHESVVQLFDHRWDQTLAEAYEYFYEAAQAWDYYADFERSADEEDPDTDPFQVNLIRRDVDQMTSRVLDADLVVNPKGRFEAGYDTGELLIDLLQYTRDEEINWRNDLEDATQDCFHTGEGCLMEQWDPQRAKGKGMPRADWVDMRFVTWDTSAREWQRQDAAYVLYFPPLPVNRLKRKWGLDEVDPDYPGKVGEISAADRAQSQYTGEHPGLLQAMANAKDSFSEPMAFEKHMWEKKKKYDVRYIDIAKEVQATVIGLDGEPRPMEKGDYDGYAKGEQKLYQRDRQERGELWHTIIVNDTVVKRDMSIYDRSKGGHGKGEISYLSRLQNLSNRILARWLEQLVVASTNYVIAERGSLSQEDEEKVRTGSADPVQLLRPHPGFKPPQVIGGNATGADVLNSGFQFLDQIRDKVSGIYDVHRGQMPYQTSGKGIRALLGSISTRSI